MKLNKSQELAVNHNRGAMLVLAGPGSGKTAVITGRTRELIERFEVAPEKILVITFSRAAALEMKERFLKLTEGRYAGVFFGTFHAIFFKILKHAYGFDNSSIVTDEERYIYLKDAVRTMDIPTAGVADFYEKTIASIGNIKAENGDIMKAKVTALVSPDKLMKLYEMYQKRLKTEQKLDFDDMMLKCLELFEERPDILKLWQERYEYILIDEFQDINRLQYRLVRLLAAPEDNLFAVGDDDQSIYGFRGARPEVMFSFEKDYRGCRRILLDVNYRSNAEILKVSRQLIVNNRDRFGKNITSAKGPGGVARHLHFETLAEEEDYILDYIVREFEASRKYPDCAILYRMNHEVRPIYRRLCAAKIPCRLSETMSCLFDHWIAADIRSYLLLAAGDEHRECLMRVINRPKRYVSRECFAKDRVTIDDLIEMNEGKTYVTEKLLKLKRDLMFIAKLDVSAAIRYIRKAVDYDSYLEEYAAGHGTDMADIYEVCAELEEAAKGVSDVWEWIEAEKNVRENLKKELQRKKELTGKSKETAGDLGAVSLMTFHCSKGLEFDTVFIIDASEGMVPQKRAESPEDIEEERRAFYVAATRARKELYVCEAEERLGRQMSVSRFVGEMFGK